MKSLELNLKKSILIVEAGEIEEIIDVEPGYDSQQLKDKKVMVVRSNMNFICCGSDLTEEIAEDFVDIYDLSYYTDYNGHNARSYCPNRHRIFHLCY